MVFSSLQFIYIFLPVFFMVYFLTPAKDRNVILYLGSLVFYTVGVIECPWYLLLLLSSVLVDFAAGLAIGKGKKRRTFFLIAGVGYHLVFLIFFKYMNQFIPENNWLLPAGISFYSFQGISYLADVYRKKCKPEPSFLKVATYISMFPQLIAGPIVTYDEVADHLDKRRHSKRRFLKGMEFFIGGLALKVLLANPMGSLFTELGTIGYESVSTPLAWMGILAFTFQIYFDFFGYSLMAIGLGYCMGFKLPKNFNHPYMSKTMTEFWRRWHITLGRWFREYVYIPMGGNRKGGFRTLINLAVVWFLTGIWHGSSVNFLMWAGFILIFILLEKLFLRKIMEKFSLLGHLYMFLLIPLSWVFFAITDFSSILVFMGRLFPFDGNFGVYPGDYLEYLGSYWYLFIPAFFLATPLPYKLYGKCPVALKVVGMLVLLGGATYCMFRGMNDPFLYFRF